MFIAQRKWNSQAELDIQYNSAYTNTKTKINRSISNKAKKIFASGFVKKTEQRSCIALLTI